MRQRGVSDAERGELPSVVYAGAAGGVFVRELCDAHPDAELANADARSQRLLSMRGLDVSDAERG